MASLTIRELPSRTISTLRSRARCNHRSLNGEVLYLMDYIASFGDQFEFSVTPPENPEVKEQKDAILALAGTWIDDRTEEH